MCLRKWKLSSRRDGSRLWRFVSSDCWLTGSRTQGGALVVGSCAVAQLAVHHGGPVFAGQVSRGQTLVIAARDMKAFLFHIHLCLLRCCNLFLFCCDSNDFRRRICACVKMMMHHTNRHQHIPREEPVAPRCLGPQPGILTNRVPLSGFASGGAGMVSDDPKTKRQSHHP